MQAIIVNLVTLVPLCAVILMLTFNPVIDKIKKKYFLHAFILIAVESCLETITILNVDKTKSAAIVSEIVNAFGFSLAPFVLFFMICSITHKTRYQKYEKLLLIPLLINAAFVVMSIKYDIIFKVTADNVYYRGKFFALQIVFSFIYLAIFMIGDLCKNRRYLKEEKLFIVASCVLCLLGIFIQSFNKDCIIIWGTISVCMIMYYINFQNNLLKHDELTDLLTRRMYKINLMKINNRKSAVIINIDINSFKTINDTFGHSFGDDVLKECAINIQRNFVEYGFAYRTGGDEFAVICNDISPKQIEYAFKRIEDALKPITEKVGMKKLLAYGYNVYTPEKYEDIFQSEILADEFMYSNKTKIKEQV